MPSDSEPAEFPRGKFWDSEYWCIHGQIHDWRITIYRPSEATQYYCTRCLMVVNPEGHVLRRLDIPQTDRGV